MSIGRLFGNAVQHWIDHQKIFWLAAGGMALLFGAIQLYEEYSGSKQASGGGYVAVAYALMLNFWMMLMLDPDHSKRQKTLSVAERKKQPAGPTFGFLLFCATFFLALMGLSLYFAIPFLDQVSSKNPNHFLLVGIIVALTEPIALLLVTLLFANFLLYLPARAVRYPLDIGAAFTLAKGVRLRLIGFALLCGLMAVIATLTLIVGSAFRLPDVRWIVGLIRALATLIDCFVLYVLANGISQMFIAQTGWKPTPIKHVADGPNSPIWQD